MSNKVASTVRYKDNSGIVHEYDIGAKAENILMPDGSSLVESTIFDYVVKDQASFDKLIASPTWLGANNVLFDGSNSLEFEFSSNVTVPDTVCIIYGINDAKIKGLNGSEISYATEITDNKYMVSNILFTAKIRNFRNLCNVKVVSEVTHCTNLFNCVVESRDISECTNLFNCTIVTPFNKYESCDRLINCKGGTFSNCTNIFTTEEFVKNITGELSDLSTEEKTNLVSAINSLNSSSFSVHPGTYDDPNLCRDAGVYNMAITDLDKEIGGVNCGTLLTYPNADGVMQVFISSASSISTAMSYRLLFGGYWTQWVPMTGLIKEVGFGDTSNAFVITRETDHLSIRYRSNS